jgi:carbamoyl-phosphate synthase large subunit
LKNNIKVKLVKKAYEGRPNIIDLLNDNKIDLVINTTEGLQSIEDSKGIRILALEKNLSYYTSISGAWAAAHSMEYHNEKNLSIISLQELNKLDHIN